MKVHLTKLTKIRSLRLKKPQAYIYAALLLLLILTSITFSQIRKKQNEFKTVNDPEKAEKVSQTLKETVGKIYVLPNESPKVATVVDKALLPDGQFYSNAQEGDKILIFEESRKIILYRPSINKVVDVGELQLAVEIPAQEVAGIENSNASTSSQLQTQPNVIFSPVGN